jgi:uncharacterized protein YigE (DUF2233 family)
MSWSTVKIIKFFLIFPPFFLFQPGISQAQNYLNLADGLEYSIWQPPGTPVRLHLLRVDLKKLRIIPIDARVFGSPLLNVREMGKKTGALAVLNANFFDTDNRPLGLVLQNGKIKNGIHPTQWYAAFLIKNNKAKVLKVFKQSQVRGYQSGIQAGPRLVVAGKIPKLKNKKSPKSAVGIDRQGRVLLIASEGSLEIHQLAELLARPTAQGGLGLSHALNLDGGSSTQFYLNAGGKSVYQPGLTGVPIALGVFTRKGK